MKKYVFSETVNKKVTKHEIVAETLKEAQAELGSDVEMMTCDVTQEDQVKKVYENIQTMIIKPE